MLSTAVTILSLVLSLIAIVVSYRSSLKARQTSVQPMLVFVNQGKSEEGKTSWCVENVGNGPALNVLVAAGDTKLNWRRDDIVLLSAIGRGVTLRLGWITITGALLATYSDAYGRQYTSICVGNRNSMVKGNSHPGLEPARFQYQLKKRETIME